METDADILCLTETWFDDSIPSHGFVPEGYRIIRKDRSNDFKQKYGRNKGGGIAVIYKAHFPWTKVKDRLFIAVKSFNFRFLIRNESIIVKFYTCSDVFK